MSIERARRRRAARRLAEAEKKRVEKIDDAIRRYKPRCPDCNVSFVVGDRPVTCSFCQYNLCAECVAKGVHVCLLTARPS